MANDEPDQTDREHRDVDRERRDLYAVSLAIILFELAQGTFTGEMGTMFGGIRFGADPAIFMLIAWIAWVYFFWRFRVAAGDVFTGLYIDARRAVLDSSLYKHFTTKQLEQYRQRMAEISTSVNAPEQRVTALAALANTDWEQVGKTMLPLPVPRSKLRTVSFRKMTVRDKPLRAFHMVIDDPKSTILGMRTAGEWTVPVGPWLAYSVQTLAIVVFGRSYFGDRMLPYLTAAATPAIVWLC